MMLAWLPILAVVYFVAGKLGLALAFLHPSASPVWPPTGIALAAILILGHRVWPGIFLGAFLVNITTAGSLATSMGIATGNTLEGLVGAYLVRRFDHGPAAVWGPPWLDRPRNMLTFAVLAGLVSTMISATVGVTSLVLGGFASWADYGAIWVTWWLGDTAGALIVAPPLLFWITHPRAGWTWQRWVEAVLLLGFLILVGQSVFGVPQAWWLHFPALICAPALGWAAYRFGPRETATAALVLAGIAIWGTLRGYGPFAARPPNESLLLVQAFTGVMAVLGTGFAGVLAERRRLEGVARRAEALEAVRRLANAAAHEINNPLAVIVGQLELLRKELDTDAQARLRIQQVLDAGDQIRAIVAHMLHITRLETAAQHPSDVPKMLDLRKSSGRRSIGPAA